MSLPHSSGDRHDTKTKGLLKVELAWEVLKELGASERYFNNLETEYRKLASLWLLASFAGMENTQGEGKVVTTRLRWFDILLTAAPVIFSALLFILWCQRNQGRITAWTAVALLALYLVVVIAAIWRISSGLKSPISE